MEPQRPPSAVESMLDDARRDLDRLDCDRLRTMMDDGTAYVVDVRPVDRRERDGHIPGAVVVDRLVLEWRLDPSSPWRMAGAPAVDDVVVVVCNEGFSSSLCARDLQRLGLRHATDLVGGFAAWAGSGHAVADSPTRVVH